MKVRKRVKYKLLKMKLISLNGFEVWKNRLSSYVSKQDIYFKGKDVVSGGKRNC